MATVEILLIAVGLAMDASAVSMAAGASGQAHGGRAAFRLSFHFGLFQFLMPVIGWYLGSTVAPLIAGVDQIHHCKFATENIRVGTGDQYCSVHAIERIDFLQGDREFVAALCDGRVRVT